MTDTVPSTVTTAEIGAAPLFLSAADVARLLPVDRAADAIAEGFLARKPAELDGIARTVLKLPGAGTDKAREMLLMPATGAEGSGLKLVTVVRDNAARGLPLIQGLYVLLSPDGLSPELVIDGGALTRLRTAAVSALATRYLARGDSQRLVVFGAGAQATAHVEAMLRILPIRHVTVVSRAGPSRRRAELVQSLRQRDVEAVTGEPPAVAKADVVCTCTTSTGPLFADRDVPAGAHINAIGAYRPDMCELPAETLARALVVVESFETARTEAGDVLQAIARGALPAKGFASDLLSVLNRSVSRTGDEQVTVFKSVGLAVEDLIVARALASALDERGP